MSAIEKLLAIPAADIAELNDAIAAILRGVRDPLKMERAARELDEGREEIRRRLGETNIAAELTDLDDE